MLAKYSDEKILVSAHETITAALICAIEQVLDEQIFEAMKKISLDNASLTIYSVQNNFFERNIINDTSHL